MPTRSKAAKAEELGGEEAQRLVQSDGDGDSSGDRAKGTKQPMVLSNVKKLAIKIHNLTSFVCDKRDARASEQDFREACQLLQRFELGLYVSVASASFKRATICSPFDKGSITVMNGGATQNMKIFIKTKKRGPQEDPKY